METELVSKMIALQLLVAGPVISSEVFCLAKESGFRDFKQLYLFYKY